MMKENEFYDICDKVECLKDATDGYFPTVDELKAHGVEEDASNFVHLIAYFASDPFNRDDIECKNTKDYKELVDFCKKILPTIKLDESKK